MSWCFPKGSETAGRGFQPGTGKAILNLAQAPWRIMFAIASYAGLRVGELLRLSIEDVEPGIDRIATYLCRLAFQWPSAKINTSLFNPLERRRSHASEVCNLRQSA